jgi:hypothetical protein
VGIAVLLLILGILVAVSCAVKLLSKDREGEPEQTGHEKN